jgi:hypothetical protein
MREKTAFSGQKPSFWGSQKGQNPGFEVTDSLMDMNYKLFTMCKLQAMDGQEAVLHRGGGWGSGATPFPSQFHSLTVKRGVEGTQKAGNRE